MVHTAGVRRPDGRGIGGFGRAVDPGWGRGEHLEKGSM